VLPSHAGDDAVEATWPQHSADAESYWRHCCRIMLATTLPRQLGHNAM
jgi:hypothetical protein